MHFSTVFVATVALYLATGVTSRAVEVEARHKKHTSKPHSTKTTKTKTSSQTSSSSEPTGTIAPPPPTGGSGGSGGTFDSSFFFPVPYQKAFTTLPQSLVSGNLSFVDMSLDALTATHISGGVTQDVVAAPGGAPSGVKAFEAKYPKGSYNPTGTPRGGFGFYLGDPASDSSFKFEGAKEIVYSYAVYFPDGFQWNKGGKIPGPYGGSTADIAYGCSGGRQDGRDKCFSLRMMWRTDGMGEVYGYLPKVKQNDDVIMALKGSVADPAYGYSIARGAFTFPTGKWTVLAERVKLNDFGSANGELELFVNGESKIKAIGLVISQNADTTFRGGHFQTFFGGSNNTWATPVDTETYFAGVSASIIS